MTRTWPRPPCSPLRPRSPGFGDLARIKDLEAYFCRILINEVYPLLGRLASARPYDPAILAAMTDAESSALPAGERAATRLLVPTWLERFRAERAQLRATVPGRSPQPDRYRDLTVQAAEHILRTALDGNVSCADCNEALQAPRTPVTNTSAARVATSRTFSGPSSAGMNFCPEQCQVPARADSSMSGNDSEEAIMSKDTWTKIRRLLSRAIRGIALSHGPEKRG